MKCSKCGYKVAEHVPGTLSCVCSDHQIGSFAPRPETWSRPTTHAADAPKSAAKKWGMKRPSVRQYQMD